MRNILDCIFVLAQVFSLLLGTCVVVTQMLGIAILDGGLAIWAKSTFQTFGFYLACGSAVTAYILAYIYKWKPTDS